MASSNVAKGSSRRYQRLTGRVQIDGVIEVLDHSYVCDGCYGCNTGEDYCRGGQYSSFEISQPNYLDRYLLAEYLIRLHSSAQTQQRAYTGSSHMPPATKTDTRLVYALSRRIENDLHLLGMLTDEDSYEIETEPGYYGQEIDGIVISYKTIIDRLNDHARAVMSVGRKDGNAAIRASLMDEYGTVLPRLQQAEFQPRIIDASKLVITNRAVNSERVRHYENGIHGFGLYDKPVPARGRKAPVVANGARLLAIVRERDKDGNYRVIDGNHRVTAFGNSESPVMVLVATSQ